MKRYHLFSIILVFLGLNAQEPYRPYPIIWCHGLWSSPGTWGVGEWEVEGDPHNPDNVEIKELREGPGSTIWEIKQTYFDALAPNYYPNYSPTNLHHIYQEVVLFDPSDASIDYRDENDIGRGWKLVKKAREVLREYYGENWENNPDAKVIFIGHSMGAPSIRYALEYDPVLADHTYKVITIGGVHQGSVWATPGINALYLGATLYYPMILLFREIFQKVIESEAVNLI